MNELADLAERFLSAHADGQRDALRRVAVAMREGVATGQIDEAATALRQVVLPTLDYTSAQSLHRIYRQIRAAGGTSAQRVRLAILGSFTTQQLAMLLELYLFAAGVDAEIYEADYGVFRQEILDGSSRLYEFGPQLALLATGWRDLSRRPDLASSAEEVDQCVESELQDWAQLWQTVHERVGCQVIQNNFVAPPWRPLANFELRAAGSLGRYVALMNRALADRAPPFVTVHDVDHLAATWGRWQWDDPRFVHQAKLPCAPECLVDYAHSLASLVAAQLGLAKKCLVLDLDNTLWGGVIGDDGLGGVRLGQGDPEGEAFLALQEYVKSLRHRGVILAVCSKNQDATAREVFERHSEMVLRLEDIAAFVANWDDKATNLRAIAEELNIGLNSLVFVDDNPAERAIVRQLVPEVAVPELPADVTGYVQAIERHRYFQVLSVGAEDFRRTDYYRADALRRVAQTSSADIDGYLASLEMVARIAPIDAATLERSVQLIQRSNQFNLTTRRRSAADVSALVDDDSWITRTVSLADRFGDNGLISVVLGRVRENVLEIDTWLMSCRVLKRGVEQSLLNHLCELACERGLDTIRGEYIPTKKNSLVQRHYRDLGFTPVGSGEDGATYWELKLPDEWRPAKHFIREIAADGYVTR